MLSIARNHFPQFVWRNGEKLLWNPILKKRLKNRPEERVRLRIIEALLEAGWSKHRISTEEAVNVQNEISGRTDIVCYDRDFKPRILVECKAENVPITTGVAEQTARYNQSVGAPFLLMSNGVSDFWYQIIDRNIIRLDDPPDFLNINADDSEKEFNYWKTRGFAGDKARPILRDWIVSALSFFWFEAEGKSQFLTFRNSPTDLELAHYFKIFKTGTDKIALGSLNTPFGGTRLIAIINKKDENVGVFEIDLDLLASGEKANSICYRTTSTTHFDMKKFLPLDSKFDSSSIKHLPESLNEIFNQLN